MRTSQKDHYTNGCVTWLKGDKGLCDKALENFQRTIHPIRGYFQESILREGYSKRSHLIAKEARCPLYVAGLVLLQLYQIFASKLCTLIYRYRNASIKQPLE